MAATFGILASLVGPAVEIGKYIAAPIKRQFSYLCCFSSNIQSLRNECKKLEDAIAGLQMQIDVAENNAQVIFPEVETWLRNAYEIQNNTRRIQNEIPNVESGCFTISLRYSHSKTAKRASEAMKELRDHCKFDRVSLPAPPAAMVPAPLGPLHEFGSRKLIEEDIMKTLREQKVNVVGISGMGGIGKTTMAEKLMHRVREEGLFHEVVMVVVTQGMEVLKIQGEMAELLGLELGVEGLKARAHKLCVRLMGAKRILIVLDDIWEQIKLEDLGIQFDSGLFRCAVLLTSRNKEVLNQMNATMFSMRILPEREAWSLFKDKIGTFMDDPHFISIAEQVVKECKGLPVALVTVGSALKDKKSIAIWKDALLQLKGSHLKNMPTVHKEVYLPLKLSYGYLKNREAESLFLLCSLFPEDSNICLEQLTFYCMGLCLFGGVCNVEQTRDRLFTLVDMLKSRFLLLDGSNGDEVKMHDVVRDVAIEIASEEGLVDASLSSSRHSHISDCKWFSVLVPETTSEIPHHLVGCNFRNLQLFSIHYTPEWLERLEMNDLSFLAGMKKLHVLSFINISFKLLPQTVEMLKNLQVLHLVECRMENISVVGDLLSLEILSCVECDKIEELPFEIGKLTNLMFLEFTRCENLKRIAPGIISKLVNLEELKLLGTFIAWESAKVSAEARTNASLKELEPLTKMTCLEIEIQDPSSIAEEICLPTSIVKYKIMVNGQYYPLYSHEKSMVLGRLPRESHFGDWIHKLVQTTQGLYLEGGGSNKLVLSQAHNVKSLEVSCCGTLKKLASTTIAYTASTDIWNFRFAIFPDLEFLKLSCLPNLEEIYDGPIPEGSTSFKNLRVLKLMELPAVKHLWPSSNNQSIRLSSLCEIDVSDCGDLRNLLSLEVAKDGFLQLRGLEIISCEMMEHVFSNEGNQDHRTRESCFTFSKLEKLELCSLPRLTTFCTELERIEFPRLTRMKIVDCSKLTSIILSAVSNQTQKTGTMATPFICSATRIP